MNKKIAKKQLDRIIGIFLMMCFLIYCFTDYLNYIQHNLPDWDAVYNATVCANLVRYGKYMVSYPDNITFYNIITTGQTVLLPATVLFKIFGISYVATSVIPIIYSFLTCCSLYILLTKSLNKFNWSFVLSAIVLILIILSDGIYYRISTNLLGEIAALFFLLVSFIFLHKYFSFKKNRHLIISRISIVSSLLTKSAIIFFVVCMLGIFIIETFFTKRIKYKGLISFVIGLISGTCILESFKIYQLGSFLNWIN